MSITPETQPPPGAEQIGKWLEQNKDEKGYFVRPATRIETYRRRVPIYAGGFTGAVFASLGGQTDNYKIVNENRTVISGFDPTFETPFQHIKIRVSSPLPNVAPEECYVVAIVSRTHIRLFWSFTHFEFIDWDKTERVGNLEWSTADAPLKSDTKINEVIANMKAKFSLFVEEPLRAKWGSGLSLEPPADGGEANV